MSILKQIKVYEQEYKNNIDNLLNDNNMINSIYHFLKSKANLLVKSIDIVKLPQCETRIIIEHYAHKLSRIGDDIIKNNDIDKGDLTFLIDQLSSAKRILELKSKDISRLVLLLDQYDKKLEKLRYIEKGETN